MCYHSGLLTLAFSDRLKYFASGEKAESGTRRARRHRLRAELSIILLWLVTFKGERGGGQRQRHRERDREREREEMDEGGGVGEM